ncbi:Cysteine desulfurase SufS [Durusdinium trenchii]|uniref:Cysteine desulfurase SufS n=1 Tax=Durusdinium trenchii TaxID=1381693 RepID=A0ABP0JR27_9DINO
MGCTASQEQRRDKAARKHGFEVNKDVKQSLSTAGTGFSLRDFGRNSDEQNAKEQTQCDGANDLMDLIDEQVDEQPGPKTVTLIREFDVAKLSEGMLRAGGMARNGQSNGGKATTSLPAGFVPVRPDLALTAQEDRILQILRDNLPPPMHVPTPFGHRRLTYADYTASGRSLRFIEEYMVSVVQPLFANTHTEVSRTGMQTTHFREEAREIVMGSLGANKTDHALIFTGSGTTAAIEKFINMMCFHLPFHLRELHRKHGDPEMQPLVLITEQEHHSNELMWRENLCEVVTISTNKEGTVCMDHLRSVLQGEKARVEALEAPEKARKIVASFSAGSNVTGLRNDPHKVAELVHEFGGLSVWDYAGAGPYVGIDMSGDMEIPDSHLDAIFVSPHKFVGGPGTPGILLARKDCFSITHDMPPTCAGGGTVLHVWRHGGVIYDKELAHREEAGTPDILGSIRCGLAFHVRNLVGAELIERIEGQYARRAVEFLHAIPDKRVWVIGENRTNINSETMRLSITSFNIRVRIPAECSSAVDEATRTRLEGKVLHPHFVSALLNDLYGIQSRSGCSCVGPNAMRLFQDELYGEGDNIEPHIIEPTRQGFHGYKPGWCRVNFNFFISEDEFQFILRAIEQIALHGWRLMPLYAFCLRTGQFIFNNRFDRFDGIRLIQEINLCAGSSKASQDSAASSVSSRSISSSTIKSLSSKNVAKGVNDKHGKSIVRWNELAVSNQSFGEILLSASEIFEKAPEMVRGMLYRFRNLRRKDVEIPKQMTPWTYFALGGEFLPLLGITEDDMRMANDDPRHDSETENPKVAAFPKHHTANPMLTFGRPKG